MKMNSIWLIVVLLCAPLCLSQEDGVYTKCYEKALIDEDNMLQNNDSDWNRAFNKDASCATLRTTDDDTLCCYMKIKFENEFLDETFTQTGCVEVSIKDVIYEDDGDFEDFLDRKEELIAKESNVDVKSLSIDCSAKFINLFTISLLLFLL